VWKVEDFEEKLNSILSSPETMGQIMALANSLSGGGEDSQETSEPAQQDAALQSGQGGTLGEISSLLQGMDSGTMQKLLALWGEYRRGDDEKARLLQALKPFLREERQEKLDRAVQIARISRVIRSAIGQFRGEGHV
jgi:uncharacterized phage infection (PIP) family protein YhgE